VDQWLKDFAVGVDFALQITNYKFEITNPQSSSVSSVVNGFDFGFVFAFDFPNY